MIDARPDPIEPPLFLDDKELRDKINPKLGPEDFKELLRHMEIERPDFPKIDPRWKGRYWPAVRQWFDIENGLVPIEAILRAPVEYDPPLALSERQGFVYFAGAGDRVKIGFTTNWRDRFRVMRTMVPVPVTPFVVIKGSRARERELHDRFAHLRCEGEWFQSSREIWSFVHAIPAEERV